MSASTATTSIARPPFEQLYARHYGRLFNLALRLTGQREEAEDILQNSFMSALRAYEQFRGDSSAYTWLYRIVFNASRRFQKERAKLPVEEYCEQQHLTQAEVYAYIRQDGFSENEVLTRQTRETCLQMFMNCMPSKYRAVFTLRRILCCSVRESAEILDISEETVRTNLHRARELIARHFEGRCSLIKPGSLCDCRAYARHLERQHKQHYLLDLELVRESERTATQAFREELRDILQIEQLYRTHFVPPAFASFIERVKQLHEAGEHRLLQY